jgi:hypothetical protein
MALTDAEIRDIAKARVSFRIHALVYVVVNAFLIGLWWFTGDGAGLGGGDVYFWPVWPLLGWGIGLAFHGWGAYGGGQDAVAREEEKLREKYKRG